MGIRSRCLLVAFALSSGVAHADFAVTVVDRCHPKPGSTTSINRLPDGTLRILFSGTPTLTYQIQVTTDLKSYTTVATAVASDDGSFSYIAQPSANGAGLHAYRTVVQTDPTCPSKAPVATNPSGPTDPVAAAAAAQIQMLWGSELSRLQAATTEAQFVALIPTLKLTPAEQSINALLGSKPQAQNLQQLMYSMNRAAMSPGAGQHELTLIATLGKNVSTTASTIQSVISASSDPDGLQRAFLLNLWASISNQQARLQTFTVGALTNDTASADSTLTATGKRTYRSSLFRVYMLTDPDLGTALIPNAARWISALHNNDDKSALLRLLNIRHPGMLMNYLAQTPITAFVQPTTSAGGAQ